MLWKMAYVNLLFVNRGLNMYAQISGHSYVQIVAEYSKCFLSTPFSYFLFCWSLVLFLDWHAPIYEHEDYSKIMFDNESFAKYLG